ncbi:MAG: Maf-like protein [Prevotellaceae bacterium]|nr:Maf-like protein [Prevotellaceae bacterium]
MLENLKKYDIVLASQSPRRQELLRGLDIPFTVRTIDVDEHYPAELQGQEIPLYLAELKSAACNPVSNELIITADTVVWLGNKVLGKPTDKADAKRMLTALSGNTHEVFTGVCLRSAEQKTSFVAATKVTFAPLSPDEINYYLNRYHPLDKAGAYGVQEWIGYIGVEHIEGSYYNVMGLPIQRLYRELNKF